MTPDYAKRASRARYRSRLRGGEPSHSEQAYMDWRESPEGALIYANLCARLALLPPEPDELVVHRQMEAGR
jgi:hypothetical protein